MGKMRNPLKNLVGKPEEGRSLRRPRCRREDNIRMDLIKEIGWEDVDWIRLAEDRDQWWVVVNTVMKFRIS
jgi:hypothetical protein